MINQKKKMQINLLIYFKIEECMIKHTSEKKTIIKHAEKTLDLNKICPLHF